MHLLVGVRPADALLAPYTANRGLSLAQRRGAAAAGPAQAGRGPGGRIMSGRRHPWMWQRHGTEARARWHYRDGEKPCEACRIAANTASAARRAQRRRERERQS